MNAKIILIFSSLCIISLNACSPLFSPKVTACQSCSPFQTNLKRRESSDLSVEKITVFYGTDNDGCKFAALQCENPTAKDILMEWYGPYGASLGSIGPIRYTQHVISLITCNQNSEWTFTENDKTEIIHSVTCESIL